MKPVCGAPTLRGGTCAQAPLSEGLPCCWNHLNWWCGLKRTHLIAFLRSDLYEVDRAYVDPEKVVHILLIKKRAFSRGRYASCLDLRVTVQTAIVCADYFATLGHEEGASSVLEAVQNLE